jgi:hypothetical protein
VAAAAAAEGLGFAVLVADDEVGVADVDDHTAAWLLAAGGSRAAGPDGAPVAWPWTPDDEQPGHGAARWSQVDAIDLLSAMSLQGNRVVVADRTWVEAAGDPAGWLPPPDALRLGGLDDLDTYLDLLDRWQDIAAVGPLTWIETRASGEGGWRPPGASRVDVERALLSGSTVATNGPRLVLEVDGAPPGSLILKRGPVRARVRVEAPRWIPLTGAALYGSGGRLIALWTVSDGTPRLDATAVLLPGDWVVAACWGDEANPPLQPEPAWAITSPVWTGRP